MGLFETGASKGGKEFRAMSEVKGLRTDSNWKAKEKRDKAAAKKQAARDRKEAKAAEGKGGFWS